MARKASDHCTNPECGRKFGDVDDRSPDRNVEKARGSSAFCSKCYYAKYEKNSDRKKSYMKKYNKDRRFERKPKSESLLDGYLRES